MLGVRTNLEFLRDVLADPDVRAGRLDTGLLARLIAARTPAAADRAAVVAAVLARHAAPRGPWGADGWRLGEARPTRYEVGDTEVAVLGPPQDATVAVGDDPPVHASLRRRGPAAVELELEGVVHRLPLAEDGPVTWAGTAELRFRSRVERLEDELAAVTRGSRPADPEVRSPMPGIVVSVDVRTGDRVVAGQSLLTIEAMKMEHRVVAPSDGVVTLAVRPTDQVALDHVVATITGHPDEGTPA